MVEANDSTEAKDIGEADGSMEDNDYMMGPEYIVGDANATKESEEDMVARDMVEADNTEETSDKANDDSSLIWDYFDLSSSKLT